jgi:hypothetical protein
MTTTVNVHEAKTHFSKLLQRVLEGEEIIIAKPASRWRFSPPHLRRRSAACPAMTPVR